MKADPIIRIVDDDAGERNALEFLLCGEDWKVRKYSRAAQFLEIDDLKTPGCLILDIRMPEMTGLELQEELNRRRCTLPVIFLTGHGDIDMAVTAVKRGAQEFLQKPVDSLRLLSAIEKHASRSVKGQELASPDIHEAVARWELLTEKEQQVIRLISQGLLNKDIALRFGNSVRTIEAQRASATAKLRLKQVSELKALLSLLAAKL